MVYIFLSNFGLFCIVFSLVQLTSIAKILLFKFIVHLFPLNVYNNEKIYILYTNILPSFVLETLTCFSKFSL